MAETKKHSNFVSIHWRSKYLNIRSFSKAHLGSYLRFSNINWKSFNWFVKQKKWNSYWYWKLTTNSLFMLLIFLSCKNLLKTEQKFSKTCIGQLLCLRLIIDALALLQASYYMFWTKFKKNELDQNQKLIWWA